MAISQGKFVWDAGTSKKTTSPANFVPKNKGGAVRMAQSGELPRNVAQKQAWRF